MPKKTECYDVKIEDPVHIQAGEESSGREAAKRFVDQILNSPIWQVKVEGPRGKASTYNVNRETGEITFVYGD